MLLCLLLYVFLKTINSDICVPGPGNFWKDDDIVFTFELLEIWIFKSLPSIDSSSNHYYSFWNAVVLNNPRILISTTTKEQNQPIAGYRDLSLYSVYTDSMKLVDFHLYDHLTFLSVRNGLAPRRFDSVSTLSLVKPLSVYVCHIYIYIYIYIYMCVCVCVCF